MAGNAATAPVAEKQFWEHRRQAALLAKSGLAPTAGMRQAETPVSPSARRTHDFPPDKLSTETLENYFSRLTRGHALVESVRLPAAKPRGVLVLLQDAHEVLDAQMNAAQTLNNLAQAWNAAGRGPLAVGLEGADGDLDLAPFRALTTPSAVRTAAETSVKQGFFSGAEFFGLTTPARVRLWGIEEPGLYKDNVTALRRALSEGKNDARRLSQAQSVLDALVSAFYPPALRELEKNRWAFAENRLGLGEYAEALMRQAPPDGVQARAFLQALAYENKLDKDRVEEDRARFLNTLLPRLSPSENVGFFRLAEELRNGHMSAGLWMAEAARLGKDHGISINEFPSLRDYGDYATATDKLDRTALLQEIRDWEAKAFLAEASEDQKNLFNLATDLSLINKLSRFALSRDEWRAYADRRQALADWPQRAAQLGANVPAAGWAEFLRRHEDFYEAALARDRALLENLWAKAPIPETGWPLAVLVAGGFHADGIRRGALDKGWACVSLLPAFKPAGDEDPLAGFRVEKSDLDKLLEGDRIFLKKTLGITRDAGQRFFALSALWALLEEMARRQGSAAAASAFAAEASALETRGRAIPALAGLRLKTRVVENAVHLTAAFFQRGTGRTVEVTLAPGPGEPGRTGAVFEQMGRVIRILPRGGQGAAFAEIWRKARDIPHKTGASVYTHLSSAAQQLAYQIPAAAPLLFFPPFLAALAAAPAVAASSLLLTQTRAAGKDQPTRHFGIYLQTPRGQEPVVRVEEYPEGVSALPFDPPRWAMTGETGVIVTAGLAAVMPGPMPTLDDKIFSDPAADVLWHITRLLEFRETHQDHFANATLRVVPMRADGDDFLTLDVTSGLDGRHFIFSVNLGPQDTRGVEKQYTFTQPMPWFSQDMLYNFEETGPLRLTPQEGAIKGVRPGRDLVERGLSIGLPPYTHQILTEPIFHILEMRPVPHEGAQVYIHNDDTSLKHNFHHASPGRVGSHPWEWIHPFGKPLVTEATVWLTEEIDEADAAKLLSARLVHDFDNRRTYTQATLVRNPDRPRRRDFTFRVRTKPPLPGYFDVTMLFRLNGTSEFYTSWVENETGPKVLVDVPDEYRLFGNAGLRRQAAERVLSDLQRNLGFLDRVPSIQQNLFPFLRRVTSDMLGCVTKNGSVLAAGYLLEENPSMENNPAYGYNWLRDGALFAHKVLKFLKLTQQAGEANPELRQVALAHLDYLMKALQVKKEPDGRWTVNGALDAQRYDLQGRWQPNRNWGNQSDGPAHAGRFVLDCLQAGLVPVGSEQEAQCLAVLEACVNYVRQNITAAYLLLAEGHLAGKTDPRAYDWWEELSGLHAANFILYYSFLQEILGAQAREGDGRQAAWSRMVKNINLSLDIPHNEIEPLEGLRYILERHTHWYEKIWTAPGRFIGAHRKVINSAKLETEKRSRADAQVLAALLYAKHPPYGVTDELVMGTFNELDKGFERHSPMPARWKEKFPHLVLWGRYEGDRYDGVHRTDFSDKKAGPWHISMDWAAQYSMRVIQEMLMRDSFDIAKPEHLEFLRRLGLENDFGESDMGARITRQDRRFKLIIDALVARVDETLAFQMAVTPENESLREQLAIVDGELQPRGARALNWSNWTFLNTVLERAQLEEILGQQKWTADPWERDGSAMRPWEAAESPGPFAAVSRALPQPRLGLRGWALRLALPTLNHHARFSLAQVLLGAENGKGTFPGFLPRAVSSLGLTAIQRVARAGMTRLYNGAVDRRQTTVLHQAAFWPAAAQGAPTLLFHFTQPVDKQAHVVQQIARLLESTPEGGLRGVGITLLAEKAALGNDLAAAVAAQLPEDLQNRWARARVTVAPVPALPGLVFRGSQIDLESLQRWLTPSTAAGATRLFTDMPSRFLAPWASRLDWFIYLITPDGQLEEVSRRLDGALEILRQLAVQA